MTTKLCASPLLALLLLCGACTTTKYVAVPVATHDTIIELAERIDSVTTYDSVYIREKGDTLIRYEYKYIDRYRIKTDSIYISRVDTLTKVEIKEVEKKESRIDGIFRRLGKLSIALWLLIALAFFAFAYLRGKFVKH